MNPCLSKKRCLVIAFSLLLGGAKHTWFINPDFPDCEKKACTRC
jgi:hypothetical protein